MPEESSIQDSPSQQSEAQVDNPHLENIPDVKVAANIDSELNQALDKAFASHENKENSVEKTESPNQKEKESKSKENVKRQEKDQGVLPDPKEIIEPAKLSAQNREGWNALRNNYTKARDLASQREEEIKKLKAGLAEKSGLSAKEIETLKKENQELSKYRTMIDIQADPEFVSKFDAPIEKSIETVREMLLGMQVDPEIVDKIDFGNIKLMDQIIGHVAEHRDKITAKRLERKVEEIADLMDKRSETLSSQKTAYQDFVENKKKESSLKGAEEEGRMIKHLELIADAKDEKDNHLFPFLNKIIPEENADQLEIDRISHHNKLADLMQQKINAAIRYSTPEEKAELAVAAVSAHYLQAQLKAATRKISGLEEELKKISTVSSDTEKNKGKSVTRNGSIQDIDSALASHFSR